MFGGLLAGLAYDKMFNDNDYTWKDTALDIPAAMSPGGPFSVLGFNALGDALNRKTKLDTLENSIDINPILSLGERFKQAAAPTETTQPTDPFAGFWQSPLWKKLPGAHVPSFEDYLNDAQLKANANEQIGAMNAALVDENRSRRRLAREERGVERGLHADYDTSAKQIQKQDKKQAANLRKQTKKDEAGIDSDLDRIMHNARLAVSGGNVQDTTQAAVETQSEVAAQRDAANSLMSDIDRSGAANIASQRAAGGKRSAERHREINDEMYDYIEGNRDKMATNMRLLPSLMMQLADTAMGRDIQKGQLGLQRGQMIQGGMGAWLDYQNALAKAQSEAGGGMYGEDLLDLAKIANRVVSTNQTTDDAGNVTNTPMFTSTFWDPEEYQRISQMLGAAGMPIPPQQHGLLTPPKPKEEPGFWDQIKSAW